MDEQTIRSKKEIFNDFISYVKDYSRSNVDLEFSDQYKYFYYKSYVDGNDRGYLTSAEQPEYSMNKMIIYSLIELHDLASNGTQITMDVIKDTCQKAISYKMEERKEEDFYFDVPSFSTVVSHYFDNVLSEDERKLFNQDEDVFVDEFVDETGIDSSIYIDLDEYAKLITNEKILVQVSDLTPVEVNYDLGLGKHIVSSNLAAILSGNPENFVEVENSPNPSYSKKYAQKMLFESLSDLISSDDDNKDNAVQTGIMRQIIERTGLTADILSDFDKYNSWIKEQTPDVKKAIANMIKELDETAPYLSHITYFATMPFHDALAYNVARRIINRDFPMNIELGIGDWQTEYSKDTKRIPEELIDPNLRYAGLELKNVTATIIAPVSGANGINLIKEHTIQIPLDSVYVDQIHPNVTPQIGSYNMHHIYGESDFLENKLATYNDCVIPEDRLTEKLIDRFGCDKDFKLQLEQKIQAIDDEIKTIQHSFEKDNELDNKEENDSELNNKEENNTYHVSKKKRRM